MREVKLPCQTSPRAIGAVACFAILLAGCAQQAPTTRTAQRGSEYFPSSKYGAASPRVVADGQPVPRGGGQYLVGRSYSIAGRRYHPAPMAVGQSQVGKASWYGAAFHGRRTANGEVYDMASITAAHPTMPLPSYARVSNLENGRSIIVRVNDRGPYHGGRVMDLSSKAAEALDTKRRGTATVKLEYLGPASLAGSDDARLFASLRTDGRPATLDGAPSARPTMVAEAATAPLTSFLTRIAQSPPPEPAAPRVAPAAPPLAQVASLRAAPVGGPAAPMPANAPLPPSRPFDLGTIPGAGVPIGPPPRLRQAYATFYAPHRDAIAEALARDGAFDSFSRLEKSQRFSR